MRNELSFTKIRRCAFSCALLVIICVGCARNQVPNPQLVLGITQSICEHDLRDYSEALAAIGSRPGNNPPKTDLTVQFIEESLQHAGYQMRSVDEHNAPHTNVIAEIRGTRQPDCVVELGAHYDTVAFGPGADDNGSGVAGVLAIAKALASTRCSKTIRFVFYCREELDGAGSVTHVRNILNNKESLEGVIVFQSIGYSVDESGTQQTPIRIPFLLSPPRVGNFITVVGNSKSASIGNHYERSVGKYEPDLPYYSLNRLGGFLKDAARSDHASYWQRGLPALMLTDTANLRSPHYHQPSDTIETLNFPFMTKVVRATAATMLEWAGVESNVTDEDIKSDESNLTFYREPCEPLKKEAPLESPAIGFYFNGLSRAEACQKIAEDFWDAVMRDDDELVAKLYSGWRDGGFPHYTEEYRVQEVVKIGQAYQREGIFDGTPTLVTPCWVKFASGQVAGIGLIVRFRDIAMEESCVIIGTCPI